MVDENLKPYQQNLKFQQRSCSRTICLIQNCILRVIHPAGNRLSMRFNDLRLHPSDKIQVGAFFSENFCGFFLLKNKIVLKHSTLFYCYLFYFILFVLLDLFSMIFWANKGVFYAIFQLCLIRPFCKGCLHDKSNWFATWNYLDGFYKDFLFNF